MSVLIAYPVFRLHRELLKHDELLLVVSGLLITVYKDLWQDVAISLAVVP